MDSLLVGVGISDRAAPGDDPVADAVTAEALGYDFVSAFDHPVADALTAETLGYRLVPAVGHPAGTYPMYETQTLLTWIAARTTRIGIVPRVLGVPFRRPALVAKAAESLQRLSRGRLILGLGAGYSDEEIRAAGGPDLTPGAKVGGLEDAITIVRAAWTQRVATYHGGVYSVDDLDLEPRPAQPDRDRLGRLGLQVQIVDRVDPAVVGGNALGPRGAHDRDRVLQATHLGTRRKVRAAGSAGMSWRAAASAAKARLRSGSGAMFDKVQPSVVEVASCLLVLSTAEAWLWRPTAGAPGRDCPRWA